MVIRFEATSGLQASLCLVLDCTGLWGAVRDTVVSTEGPAFMGLGSVRKTDAYQRIT